MEVTDNLGRCWVRSVGTIATLGGAGNQRGHCGQLSQGALPGCGRGGSGRGCGPRGKILNLGDKQLTSSNFDAAQGVGGVIPIFSDQENVS